jgi:hypothetical protein
LYAAQSASQKTPAHEDVEMTDAHSISDEFRKSNKVEEFSHRGELLRE